MRCDNEMRWGEVEWGWGGEGWRGVGWGGVEIDRWDWVEAQLHTTTALLPY
jgi:hypothetical protein